MKKVNVVAAVIKFEDKYLCVQRGDHKFDYIAKKWEFPGGKIEEDETPYQAIIREINEELELDVNPIKTLTTVIHTYPDFIIQLQAILCSCETKEIILTEHIEKKWLSIDELSQLDWAGADVPIVNVLRDSSEY